MKKFFILIVIQIFMLAAFLFYGGDFLSPHVQKFIVKKLNEPGIGKFQIQKLDIQRIWPLQVRIDNFTADVSHPGLPVGAEIIFKTVTLAVHSKTFIPISKKDFDVKLTLTEPKTRLQLIDVPADKQVSIEMKTTGSKQKTSAGWDFHFIFNIIKGAFELKDSSGDLTQLDYINFSLSGQNFLESNNPKKISFAALLNLPQLQIHLPITAQSDAITLNSKSIQSEKINITVAGLQSALSGFSNLTKDEHSWKASVNLPDLTKLDVPPAFLPPGKWSGAISGDGSFNKNGSQIQSEVSLITTNLKGEVNASTPEYTVMGSVSPQIQIKAAYTEHIRIENLNIDADLTNLSIKIPGLFEKNNTLPMRIKLSGDGQDTVFKLHNMRLELAQLIVQAMGHINSTEGETSEIKLVIPSTSLAGIESLLPPLNQYPVTGQVALQARFKGDIHNAAHGEVDIEHFQAQNINGGVKYESSDKTTSVIGRILVDSSGAARIYNKKILGAHIKANIDLNSLAINSESFKKSEKDPLQLQLNVVQDNTTTVIKNFNFSSDFAQLSAVGQINNTENPSFNLKTRIQSLNLIQLAKKASALKALPALGQVNGELGISGRYNAALGIEKSPLALTGNLNVNIPSYAIITTPQVNPEAAAGLKKPVELPESTPLLPKWPIIQRSKMKLNVNLSQLIFDKLKAENIQIKADYNMGAIRGQARIGNVFRGLASWPSFSTNNLTEPAQFFAKMEIQNIFVPDALKFAVPQYANYLTDGTTSGTFTISTPMPQTKNWLDQLTASGKMAGQNIQAKEDLIQKALGDKLTKIAKDKKVLSQNPKPLRGNFNTQFSLKQRVAHIDTFNLQTVDDDQFTGSGQVDLDLMAKLKGTLYLARVNIGGAVRAANSDSKGRFVLPVAVSGSLLDPSFDIASYTFEQIAKKTLQYETQNLGKKLKQDLQSVDKDKLKKKIKGLFK
ncbi:MAG: hypothetical protein KDD38_02095 [Bdellovibrionales bacterium]|nr:hypothetical protein [Bdellovibrionales bacterium]